MESQFKIVYSGRLQAKADPARFVREFAQRFGVPEEEAEKLVNPGREVPIKSNLSRELAEKYRAALEKMGMDVRVEPMSPPPPPPAEPAGGARVELPCPKCGSTRVVNDSCQDCGIIVSKYREIQARGNPYAPPQSALDGPLDRTVVAMSGPHKVPAMNGWQWVLGGWGHFRQNPGPWIGAVVIWFVLVLLLSLIPIIGGLATNLLMPVVMAGFLLGAREQDQGGDFEIGHLFAGFSSNVGQLLLVGALYMAGFFVIGIVVAAIIGSIMYGAAGGMEGLEAMQGLEQNPGQMEAMAQSMMSGPILLAILVALALMIPLLMAYWFAPALVALEGMSAIPAMKTSFKGCLKNILPFFVYGLITFVLAIVASIPFALGWLVLGPVLMAAVYASYKDIFYGLS